MLLSAGIGIGIGFAGGGAGPSGQQLFTSSQSWVVPAGVTSISAVAIGSGGQATTDSASFVRGGGGGGLEYRNAIAVTPGETLTLTVDTNSSRILRGGTTLVGATPASTFTGGAPWGSGGGAVGFSGGTSASQTGSGIGTGSGAGGYTSVGGNGGPQAGTNGLGGGGSSVLGGGAGAAAGASGNRDGLNYGGGAGINSLSNFATAGNVGPGAVRIIWGAGRSYPNTNTADV